MSDDAGRRRLEPTASPFTATFWDATRERRFLVPWCAACGDPIWYPREMCPACGGTDLEWWRIEGRGVVHAVTVLHRPGVPVMADRVPYAVALVDLVEGVRIMSNVVARDPEAVGVGDPVRLTWEPLSDGRNLPQFEPDR